MSRLLTIARNDFRHTLRDRLVWGAVILLGVMFLPSVASVSPDIYSLRDFLLSSVGELFPFSLIVIAAVGYNAVTGERAEGTVRFVLGLPGTRRDLVLGKLLSRISIVVLALGTVLIITNIFTVRVCGMDSLLPFWAMGGWMLLYGVVWTAITIGYSAAFSSQYRTLGAIILTYIPFSPTLDIGRTFVLPLFAYIFTGSFDVPGYSTIANAPHWVHIANQTNPLLALMGLARWSVSVVTGASPVISLRLSLVGLLVVVSFGVLPLYIGLRRFERADLNNERDGPSWDIHLLSGAQPSQINQGGFLPIVTSGGDSRIGTIVRGDLNRAFKSWVIQGAVALFLLMTVPGVWHSLRPIPGGSLTPAGKFLTLPYTIQLPLFILGTAIGYQAVVGERDSGTIRYILGLPSTRRDLVVGKLIARLILIVASIAPVLLFAEWVTLLRYGDPILIAFLAVAGWSLLLGIVWTTFVIGVSTAVSSRYRALATVLCLYLLFSVDNGVWGPLVRPLIGRGVTGQFSTPRGTNAINELPPFWFRYIDHLNPLIALKTIQRLLMTAGGGSSWKTTFPLILFSVIVLVAFTVGTLFLGYKRFEKTDLG